jgi:hypothetical protein
MRIMMLLKGGGPLDGEVSMERDIKPGEAYSFLETVVMIAGATSGYRYNIGHHFHVPSPGWLTRTVVRQANESGVMDSFEYVITDRVEHDDELLLGATFVGQRPDKAEGERAGGKGGAGGGGEAG